MGQWTVTPKDLSNHCWKTQTPAQTSLRTKMYFIWRSCTEKENKKNKLFSALDWFIGHLPQYVMHRRNGKNELQLGRHRDRLSHFTEYWEQWETAISPLLPDSEISSSRKPLKRVSLQACLLPFPHSLLQNCLLTVPNARLRTAPLHGAQDE